MTLDITQVDPRPLVQVTASRALSRVNDNRTHLYNSVATSFTLTVPQNTFAAGDEIELATTSTGTLIIAAGSGTTITGTLTIPAGAIALLKFYSANTARVFLQTSSGGSGTPSSFLLYSNTVLTETQTVGTDQVNQSLTIPGGTIQPNGYLICRGSFAGTGTGSKTIRVRINNTLNLYSLTQSSANIVAVTKPVLNRSNTTAICSLSSTTGESFTSATTGLQFLAVDWTAPIVIDVAISVTTVAQGGLVHYFVIEGRNP